MLDYNLSWFECQNGITSGIWNYDPEPQFVATTKCIFFRGNSDCGPNLPIFVPLKLETLSSGFQLHKLIECWWQTGPWPGFLLAGLVSNPGGFFKGGVLSMKHEAGGTC